MRNKKKWIVISVVLVAVITLGIFAFNIIVSKIFAKITGGIVDSGLLTEESVNLPDGQGGNIKFDAETVKALESKVKMSDKVAVLTLLAKALPPKEYSRLLEFINGGISDEEISEAYSIMRKYLTPEQKNKIKGYYFKYIYLIEEPSE